MNADDSSVKNAFAAPVSAPTTGSLIVQSEGGTADSSEEHRVQWKKGDKVEALFEGSAERYPGDFRAISLRSA